MIRSVLTTVLLLCIVTNDCFADGPVWKVTHGKHHVFLGGTIHLLSPSDYPLPSVFEQAYQQSQVLAFEMDPDVANSPEAQQLFLQHANYSDGRTLASVLDKSVYQSLERFLSSRGMPIDSFQTMKPSLLSVVISLVELQRLGIVSAGVDEFYSNKAKQDGKSRLFLETLNEQLTAMLSIGEGLENEIILHTLDELGRLDQVMSELMLAWRKGDNDHLAKVGFEKWPEQFPALYKALVVDRNQRWIPQIEAMLQTPEVEYVLVGALHLAGDDSVLKMLASQGYQIEKLSPP